MAAASLASFLPLPDNGATNWRPSGAPIMALLNSRAMSARAASHANQAGGKAPIQFIELGVSGVLLGATAQGCLVSTMNDITDFARSIPTVTVAMDFSFEQMNGRGLISPRLVRCPIRQIRQLTSPGKSRIRLK
jgi:hypothetical protein